MDDEQSQQHESSTEKIPEIRLMCDYGSNGLWDDGGMMDEELLPISVALLQRIAVWQEDFDNTIHPLDDFGDEEWNKKHQHEEVEIAKELQAQLGGTTRVMIYHNSRLTWIKDVQDQ